MENILGEQIFRNELNRRWKAIREAMVKAGVDCLVMQNTNQTFGGYVRYFADIQAQANGSSVIFPLDGEMTIISSGPPQTLVQPSYGVEKRIVVPHFPTLNSSNTLDAKVVVETLKEHKVKSVGFVSKASMSALFYEYIKMNLLGVNMSDATDWVDEIKAIKSETELELINKTVEMHDKLFEAALDLTRPGVKLYEISSEIRRIASNMGSEAGSCGIGSAPAGTPARTLPRHLQNRELKYGDQVYFLIEFNGPGGFYGEISRTICIGVAPKSLLDLWGAAVEAQDRTAELMKTGAYPTDLLATHNKLLTSRGYQAERRLYSHGQGYDMMERPSIRPDETMMMKAGMFMAIHPEMFVTKEAHAFCCDNFLVTDSGSIRLTKTPREIFIV